MCAVADGRSKRDATLGQTLRILSANLMNGGADPAGFAALLVAMHVDVVAVQELSHDQAEAISEVLPYGQLEPDRHFQGMGIAMRRPGEVTHIPASVRDMRRTVLDPAHWPTLTQPIEILNVHILAPHALRKPVALLRRRQQLRDLVRYLSSSSSESRVVVGDLNATPLWPVYRRIASHLTDAAVAVARKRGRRLEPTWGPWLGRRKWLRIDHGFVQGVSVEEFQVVELHESDHSAIVMDLSF